MCQIHSNHLQVENYLNFEFKLFSEFITINLSKKLHVREIEFERKILNFLPSLIPLDIEVQQPNKHFKLKFSKIKEISKSKMKKSKEKVV